MSYVEFLRMRSAFFIYAIVIVASTLIVATSLHFGHVQVDANDVRAGRVNIPSTALFAGAAFAALVFGTVISGSLNRERETLALSWTRPIPRERMALGVMLVDFGGVIAAFVLALVFGCVPLVTAGVLPHVYAAPGAANAVISMLGITVMWYGLVQAATSWYRGRAGLIVGLSWGLFTGLNFVGHAHAFGPLVAALANALNYLNPIAYLSSYGIDNAGRTVHETATVALDEGIRISIPWLIGVAACAVAIFAWKRAEA